MDDDQEVAINIRHGEKTRSTKIEIDGQEHIIKNKFLNDNTLFPWFHTLENRNWDIEIGVDQTKQQFTLMINGRPFSHLMDVNIATENLIKAANDSSNSLVGSIKFNEIQIINGEMAWSYEVMQKVVKRKIRGKPVTSIRMEKIDCSGSVMNELLQLCVDSVPYQVGLQQLRLSGFQAKIQMDVSIIDQLAFKTNNLQVLTIRDMNQTSE